MTRVMIDFTSWSAFAEYSQDRTHGLSDDFRV